MQEIDIKAFEKKAAVAATNNKKLIEKLKRNKPRDLDEHMHKFHDEAFEHIDCLTCGNCCKTTSPIFYQKDIERISKSMRMKPGDFIQKYLHIDEDQDYVLNSAPCPFLDGENYCTVYNDRPNACREYPHTDRKKSFQVLDITEKNAQVCPAVYEIVEKLKKVYNNPNNVNK